MVEKVAKYAILSFFSFCFFTFIFHAAASASTSSEINDSSKPFLTPTNLPSPTPTIFLYVPPTEVPNPSVTLTTTPIPTVILLHNTVKQNIITQQPTTLPSELPSEVTPTPTEAPSVSPTLVPTDTPVLTPTVQPTVLEVGTSDLETLFTTYSNIYHVDKDLLEKIAKCESGFNSNALNGDYTGMFQFATSSWTSVRAAMGLNTNPDLRKNAEESIRTAAYMISLGRASAWPTCSR